MRFSRILSALMLCERVVSQFVKPPAPESFITKKGYANITVRYKEVPNDICELKETTKSYSGYADVGENQHVFWWFFEARDVAPISAPLTVFLQGGPGASSMVAVFQEIGPCRINSSYKPVNNPYSWTSTSNVLFIDQPVLTGFSYSTPIPAYRDPKTRDVISLPDEECPDFATDWSCGTYSLADPGVTANSTPNAAPIVYLAIQGFMGAFPQYSSGDFILASESYGGFYGPVFSKYFLDQDKLGAPGTIPINQKALLVGNGWFDALTQYEAYYNFTVSPGNTYDMNPYNTTYEKLLYNQIYGRGNCLDQVRSCRSTSRDDVCSLANHFCESHVTSALSQVAGRDLYDVRYLTPDPFPPTYLVDYLNTPHVQEAIGAYVNFSRFAPTVSRLFHSTGDGARSLDILSDIGILVQHNITVALYFGDADYICNYLGGHSILPNISPQPPNFSDAGFTRIQTSTSNETHPRGSVRQSGYFAFARIYDSGHLVPFYQPEVALEMFKRVVEGKDIAMGRTPVAETMTEGPEMDGWRQGDGGVWWDVVPEGAEYDWMRGVPVLPNEERGKEESLWDARGGGSQMVLGDEGRSRWESEVLVGEDIYR